MMWAAKGGYYDFKLDRELSLLNDDAVISLEPLSSIGDIFNRHSFDTEVFRHFFYE